MSEKKCIYGQAMHHDNFDLWDSAHQPWNSVNIGPRRGIVEGWRAAAERNEMRFGLAFHGDYALWWFQVSDARFKAFDLSEPACSQPSSQTWMDHSEEFRTTAHRRTTAAASGGSAWA